MPALDLAFVRSQFLITEEAEIRKIVDARIRGVVAIKIATRERIVASLSATRAPRRRRRPSPRLYPRRFASAEDVALLRSPPPILIPHGRDVRQAIPTPRTNFVRIVPCDERQ